MKNKDADYFCYAIIPSCIASIIMMCLMFGVDLIVPCFSLHHSLQITAGVGLVTFAFVLLMTSLAYLYAIEQDD